MKRSVAATGTLCWHVHHDKLVGVLTGPLAKRRAYIKREKPARERALRLRLIKPVRGELPPAVVKAGAAYVKARTAYDKARAAYEKAMAAYFKAGAAYVKARAALGMAVRTNMPAILALHAKECPNCPWDGRSILGERTQ